MLSAGTSARKADYDENNGPQSKKQRIPFGCAVDPKERNVHGVRQEEDLAYWFCKVWW